MSDQTTVDESVVSKVQKILAKADRTDSPEEAAIFYAKATELMERHMISEAMLAEAGKAEKDTIGSRKMPYGSTYWQATRTTLVDLGAALGFRIILHPWMNKKNGYLMWYGWESELKMGEMLFTSLQIQMVQASNDHMRQSTNPDKEDRFREKRSFLAAFGQIVANRIAAQRRETRRQVSGEQGSSDLLPVLANRDTLLSDYIDSIASKKSVNLKDPAYHPDGYTAGRHAGSMADIGNPRVGGSRGALGQ